MTTPATIGFPRMLKEQGEKRVFLPEFVQFLVSLGAVVYLEEGYGSRSGYMFDDYRRGSEAVRHCSREEAFAQDVVLILRSPQRDTFDLLRPAAVLISMLHYPTRRGRVERLREREINAISLDSIVDDRNLRLVENMKAVAWNGLEAAFDVLEGRVRLTEWPERPIRVLVLGTGMVGKHAVEAATKLGNVARYTEHMAEGGPGALAVVVGRSVTGSAEHMEPLIREADILVDATQRRTPSEPVVPNHWIDWLPGHAVITDLAVDPYLLDADPPVVRGVEGIPMGNLNQYIFAPDDPAWEKTVPESIPSSCRRTVVSCYSWPGIHPQACMAHYAQQLQPLMRILLAKGYEGLNPDGTYFERALHRATLDEWLRSGHYRPRPR